jgi:catechol 2,3-dioxygenase-like lactoylglutathione lyase family enzyme
MPAPTPSPAPRAATARYGKLWESYPGAIDALRSVWNDSLVRAELRSFMNLSKNLLNARTASQESDLRRERELVLSAERIKRTQAEIVARMTRSQARMPARKPRLGLIMLASRDPAAAVAFYRSLLGVEPATTLDGGGGYAEFEFEGVHLAIHGQSRAAADDPYLLGPPPAAFGWGALFVFRVEALDRYYENAVSAGMEVLDRDLGEIGNRSFVVKDPSGYLIEIAEGEPRGYEDR